MEFLRSGLKSVLGAPAPGAQPTGAEIVERLVQRVNNSTLLEDRRDACRALKALSRNYRIEVGAQGLDYLVQAIELDRADCEIVSYALDTLHNVISEEQFEEEKDNPDIPLNIGEQFTEMFLKNPQNVKLILELLEEYDYRVRLPTVKLLNSLLANRPKDIQEIILVSPMGVSKLMDLLSDSREVIRNEALLLLIHLTKGNANIQKIVAFENAFDRLFDVIAAEGFSEGGIVVEDCLLLMLNLLKNNTSNQNFFKEGSYIQRMLPMFSTPDMQDDLGWSPQKASNVHCMLQLIRTLVSPLNSAAVVSNSQKIMRHVHLLDMLCNTLMISGVPTDILTETINAVGEVIRGNSSNQEFLSNVLAPSSPPRPAIVVLLMSMVNEKQPFTLRCAVVYCFECYLYKNEVGQTQLVQTLLPSTSEVSNLTTGQLLCGGLFSSDTLSNWFSAVSLMHALIDNPAQKEQLLRVLLATNVGTSPVSLLHQCTILLQQGTKLHSKVALLMFLCMWLSYCPQAISAFLGVPGSVGFLVAQICSNEHDDNEYLLQGMCAFLMALCIHFNDDSVESYTKEGLRQLLIKRIGSETFVAKLGEVSKHEMYSRAAKQPQIRARCMGELLLDYEFCKLFKTLESIIIASLTVASEENITTEGPIENRIGSEETPLLPQYKNLIRQQDAKLQELTAQIEQLSRKNLDLQAKLDESVSSNAQLRDENTLLKAQLAAHMSSPGQMNSSQSNDNIISEVQNIIPIEAQPDSIEKDNLILEYESKLNDLSQKIIDLENKLSISSTQNAELTAEINKLKIDQDDLLELLADQDIKETQYKMKLCSLGENVETEEN